MRKNSALLIFPFAAAICVNDINIDFASLVFWSYVPLFLSPPSLSSSPYIFLCRKSWILEYQIYILPFLIHILLKMKMKTKKKKVKHSLGDPNRKRWKKEITSGTHTHTLIIIYAVTAVLYFHFAYLCTWYVCSSYTYIRCDGEYVYVCVCDCTIEYKWIVRSLAIHIEMIACDREFTERLLGNEKKNCTVEESQNKKKICFIFGSSNNVISIWHIIYTYIRARPLSLPSFCTFV